jgi:hypothetical protein
VTATRRQGKKVGRKSYNSIVVWLAQKYSRNGQRSLREVAHLLAHASYGTRTGKPFGAAAVRKMIQMRVPAEDQKIFASWWEKEGRSELAERVLQEGEYHWITAVKRNNKRKCFQWLKE